MEHANESLPGVPRSGHVYLKCLAALISGIALFQFLASLSVYLSNHHLVQTINDVLKEGYLAVPNANILPGLKTVSSAFSGGIFFTLTVGALVSLLSLGCALVYLSFPKAKKYTGRIFIVFLVSAVITINLKGILFIETLAIISCSFLVFFILIRLFKGEIPFNSPKTLPIHAVPLMILATFLLVLQGKKSDLFSDFRDTFLMTNPLGMVINDFYYTHTLSPAEVFKSLEQKQIRTCRLVLGVNDEPQRPTLTRLLNTKQFVVLNQSENTDLVLRLQDGQLFFCKGDKEVLNVRLIDFFANPSGILKNYSTKTDRYIKYRVLVFISLITGLPLLMYLVMHACFYGVFTLILTRKKTSYAASMACFAIGLSFFLVLFLRTSETVSRSNLRDVLGSPDLSRRVAGLKYLADTAFDPVLYPSALHSMESTSPLERYWFARAAARSKDPMLFNRMILLLNDPQPNVACQAFYALGMMDNREAVPEIKRRIEDSGNWYVQHYAFKALTRLGWTQQRSDVKP